MRNRYQAIRLQKQMWNILRDNVNYHAQNYMIRTQHKNLKPGYSPVQSSSRLSQPLNLEAKPIRNNAVRNAVCFLFANQTRNRDQSIGKLKVFFKCPFFQQNFQNWSNIPFSKQFIDQLFTLHFPFFQEKILNILVYCFSAGIFACCGIPCERIFVKYWNVYFSAILKSLHVGNVKVIYETFIGAFQDAFP